MNADPQSPSTPAPRRLFVFESGWTIALKDGSERVFCYAMAPGQDYYHRLLDGEVFLVHGDERLCLACAERRGLISYEPRALREPLMPLDDEPSPHPGPVLDSGRGFAVLGGSDDEFDDEEE
jgi:hypothetical protein